MRTLKSILAVAALLAALSFPAFWSRAQADAPLKLKLQPTPEVAFPTNDVRRDATVAAIEKAMPSVVNVATESPISIRDPFEELFQQYLEQYYGRERPKTTIIGSGVIIDEDGYLLTNDHVVRRANKIQIQLASSREVFTATVIGHDPTRDLALLKIADAPAGTKFTPIKFAPDDDVLLGETVMALGSPLGLGGSVSRGIISAKERPTTFQADGDQLTMSCLQTDASVNPGNSGGPLVNLHGELVGINSAIRKNAQGISFAIPTRQINEALATAFTPEGVRHLWFGARVSAGSGPLNVTAVEQGSPAALAGLKVGDRVLEVNGQVPRNFVGYNELLTNSAQSSVTLTISRSGETKNMKVRLIPEPEFFNNELIQRRLGLTLQAITPELARSLGLPVARGYIVLSADAKAEAQGLQRSGVITSVDGQVVEGIVEFGKLVHRKNPGQVLTVEVIVQKTDPHMAIPILATEPRPLTVR